MNDNRLFQGIEFLARSGLNLFAVFDCALLPNDVTGAMLAQEIPLDRYNSLVLLGHGGKQLWTALAEYGWKTEDPVDHYSLATTETFIREYLDSPAVMMLYPTGYGIPLQRLGELAGWSHPSPLGLGISEAYGVWFAYRSAFLTTATLPSMADQLTVSPCDSCHDKPCIPACPAGAVQGIGALDLAKCADFRTLEQSLCRDRCLARMACPVAEEHRYTLEQIQYHYGRSLESVKLYQSKDQVK